MLRFFVFLIAAIPLAAGLWELWLWQLPAACVNLFVGTLMILGTVFERWRYRGAQAAGAQWQPTGERFHEPTTNREVEVLYDPSSGARTYREANPDTPD